jgi:excisionase family DNA binding protein
VTDTEPDPAEDPWLTLAEIAQELRVNPATVRLWVSRGKLKAKRAGQRKLLVQRSELDRMLEISSHRYDNVPTESQSPGYPRIPAPRRPVRVRTWSVYSVAKAKVPPEVMHAAVKDLQAAGAVWDTALDASENAPPDPGFIGRLRAIAVGAERQTEALDRARVIPGFNWKPVPDTENMILSNELRPGANRPGPDHLWDSFDLTVDRLALAMEGNDASLVHIEYMELAIVLREIIEALESSDANSSDSGSGGRGEAENDADGVDRSVS